MPRNAMLYICHGDEQMPKFHPCAKVQAALHAAGIEYDKVIGGKGSPVPFLRGGRDDMREAIGTTHLPSLVAPDGSVISGTKPILAWIAGHDARD